MSAAPWLEAALRAVPPRVLEWQGKAAVRERLAAWLTLQLERVEAPAFAEGFARACPWPGAAPADYLQRKVGFEGGAALVGIRFLGGSADFRFVDLLASTGEGAEALGRACRAALHACAVFAPRAVRVRQAAGGEVDPSGWRPRPDQYFLAGRLDELAARPRTAGGLSLEPAEPDAAEAFARAAYRAWAEREPGLALRVRPSGRKALAACRADGVLAFLREGTERVGLIAVGAGSDAELAGYSVEEEVIDLAHRGRRLAAAAQGLAVAALAPARPNALLFGTIDAANRASLRTAERVGREPVATYRFLLPPEAS